MNYWKLSLCFLVGTQISYDFAMNNDQNKSWTKICRKNKKKKKLNGDKEFMVACLTNNNKKTSLFFEESVNINGADYRGNTALTAASIKGHADMVASLIKAGASPNQANFEGKTPLIFAAKEGFYDVVSLLLEHGALADQRCKQGTTPLMYGAEAAVPSIVLKLIDYRADVNAQDYLKKRTPLHWALRMREGALKKDGDQSEPAMVLKTLQILLNHGANPNVRDNRLCSPIDWATFMGWKAEEGLLRSHSNKIK